MTFIQPHKQLNFFKTLVVLGIILNVVATFALVLGYNAVVNTSHNIAAAKAQLDQIGAQNTNLQNQMVALLGSDSMSHVAAGTGLVEDKKPEYLSGISNQSLSLRQ